MKQYVQASWSAFPDGKPTRVGQILTESGAATEAVFTGTHTGLLATPSGSIPPTGKKIALRQVFLHRIEDEMIASEHVYLDQLEFLTQIGLAGAPVT